MTTVFVVLGAWVAISFLCGGLLVWRKQALQRAERSRRDVVSEQSPPTADDTLPGSPEQSSLPPAEPRISSYTR